MTDTSLGTARVDLVVDTEQFQAEVNRAKNLGASIGPEFEKSMQKMSASQRRATNDALRLAQQTGKTRDEIRLISLAARGAAPQSLDVLRKSILATREEAARGAKELNKYGLSQAQYAAALRGTPAQVTDILTSLQGGQAPLTVLLQQGGQLRDMFGGIVPAARALGTALLGLVNPFTVAGAVAVALGVAYSRGSAEAQAYTQALAESGNVVGETANSLAALAARSAEAAGSQGRAAEALAAVVTTGKVARAALEDVSQATAAWASATGRNAEEVADVFARLADKPAEAAVKLNEQYHFLTASVYDQIRALEEQGRKEDAASLAQRELAQALKSRADEIKASAGTLERSWDRLAGAARSAWDAMLNIGRPMPTEELRKQAAALQQTIDELSANGGFAITEGGAAIGGGQAAIAARKRAAAQLAAIQEELSKRERDEAETRAGALKQAREEERIAAQGAVRDLIKAGRTKAQVREDELKKLREQLKEGLITQEQYEKGSKAIAERYKDPKGSSSTLAADRLLAQYSQAHAALQAQLGTQEKLGTWEKKRVEFEQQIVDLKERRSLTADQKSILARENELRAALARNVAAEQAAKNEQDAAKALALQVSLSSQLAADRQRYSDEQAAFGLGRQEQERLQQRMRLYRDYQKQIDRITAQRTAGDIDDALFRKEAETYKRNLDARIQALQDNFEEIDRLQADWSLGARGGLLDYATEAANVADATRDAFSSAFSGAEDALVSFVTTGKADVADLANSIISDLARIAIRQSIVGPLAGALAGLFGGGTSNVDVGGGITFDGGGWYSGADGGYTGPGGKYQFAGIVHKGEVVWSQADVARAGGVAAAEALRRGGGYANGGVVGGYTPPRAPAAPDSRVAPKVEVNVINQGGDQMTAQASGPRFDGEQWVIDVVLKKARNNRAFRSQLKEAVA